MYKTKNGEIVEFLNKNEPQMKVHAIIRDDEYWFMRILPALKLHFKVLIDIIDIEKHRNIIVALSEKEQNEYIKKIVREMEKS